MNISMRTIFTIHYIQCGNRRYSKQLILLESFLFGVTPPLICRPDIMETWDRSDTEISIDVYLLDILGTYINIAVERVMRKPQLCFSGGCKFADLLPWRQIYLMFCTRKKLTALHRRRGIFTLDMTLGEVCGFHPYKGDIVKPEYTVLLLL